MNKVCVFVDRLPSGEPTYSVAKLWSAIAEGNDVDLEALHSVLVAMTTKNPGTWSRDTLSRKLVALRSAVQLAPYLGIVEHYLERKLRNA